MSLCSLQLEKSKLTLCQEFGDIQEFYTQKLHPDGFCVVSYFDIRDSMTAYRKLQAEHPLSIQFCPSGYVTMVHTRYLYISKHTANAPEACNWQ